MKKSELYRLAQIAVLKDGDIAPQDKLDLIKWIEGEICLAEFTEKREEEKRAENGEL